MVTDKHFCNAKFLERDNFNPFSLVLGGDYIQDLSNKNKSLKFNLAYVSEALIRDVSDFCKGYVPFTFTYGLYCR